MRLAQKRAAVRALVQRVVWDGESGHVVLATERPIYPRLTDQKLRIGGRIANEVLMQFRAGKKSQNDVSIQEPIDSDKDGNSLTLNDVVADTFDVHEDYERKEETEALYRVVNRLSGRERQIVIMRYGLSGTQPLTQQQVADILHISRSYVSRIEKKALEELRAMMRKGASAGKG